MLMLATVRIGAIHSVVFAGFGAQRARRPHRGQRVAAGVHGRRHVPQRQGRPRSSRSWTRRCRSAGASVEHVIVLRAHGRPAADAAEGRDTDLGRVPRARRRAATQRRREMEANEPAFILATSGTTAKPKLADSHARRLPGPHRQHGPLVLRPDADRRLVGDVRHRLDRRPQLHRVRAAARRLHDGRVRGRARLPAARRATGARRSRSSA